MGYIKQVSPKRCSWNRSKSAHSVQQEIIIEEADFVIEMKGIKHHFQKGARARDGIEK